MLGGFVLAGVVLTLATPTALGGLTDVVFSVEATSASGHGSWSASITEGQWTQDAYLYQWSLAEPVDIRDPQTGEVLATLHTAAAGYRADPQVNLSFAVTAGTSDTNFTIKSALLSFPTINTPQGRASAAFTVTDGDDEGGALLTGLGGPAYTAEYNGFVPGGSAFTQLIQQVSAPVSGTGNLAEEFPGGGSYSAIGTPVYDMSSQVSFTLSANDLASGTSTFEIQAIPEPCGLFLLAACAGVFRRR